MRADDTTSETGRPYYLLDVYLIYTSEPDHDSSHKTALGAKTKIEKAFQDKYKHNGQWQQIELRDCVIMSDESLTYSQYLHLVEWRAEGLSLRLDPVWANDRRECLKAEHVQQLCALAFKRAQSFEAASDPASQPKPSISLGNEI